MDGLLTVQQNQFVGIFDLIAQHIVLCFVLYWYKDLCKSMDTCPLSFWTLQYGGFCKMNDIMAVHICIQCLMSVSPCSINVVKSLHSLLFSAHKSCFV